MRRKLPDPAAPPDLCINMCQVTLVLFYIVKLIWHTVTLSTLIVLGNYIISPIKFQVVDSLLHF